MIASAPNGLDALIFLAVIALIVFHQALQRWQRRDLDRRAGRRDQLLRWHRDGRWGT